MRCSGGGGISLYPYGQQPFPTYFYGHDYWYAHLLLRAILILMHKPHSLRGHTPQKPHESSNDAGVIISERSLLLTVRKYDQLALDTLFTNSASYTVKLKSRPEKPVKIIVQNQVGNPVVFHPSLSIGPHSLEFTSENWDQPQHITVSFKTTYFPKATDTREIQTIEVLRHAISTNDEAYSKLSYADNVNVDIYTSTETTKDYLKGQLKDAFKDAFLDELIEKSGEEVSKSVAGKVAKQVVKTINKRVNVIDAGYNAGYNWGRILMDMSDATIELLNNQERILSGDYEWQQVLAGKSFYLPLSPGKLAQQSDQQDTEVASSSSLQPSLLASFDYTNFRETDIVLKMMVLSSPIMFL